MDKHTFSLLISGREKEIKEDTLSTLDWDALAHQAHAEGVGPLLYWELSRSGRLSTLPEETKNFLLMLYGGTRIQNQKIFKELEILAHAFLQAGIELVALKGVCQALTVYPDIALRPMSDMDILIPGMKIKEAVQIAKSLGYQEKRPDVYPGLRYLLDQEIELQKRGSPPILLELHNSLLVDKSFTYAVPVEWFWTQTEPLEGSSLKKFAGLRMLSPTAQVLYASAHAILKHGKDTQLLWFYDLDRLIHHYQERLDWELMLSKAKDFNWGSALEAALLQTRAYFNTPIPGHVLEALSKHTDFHSQWVALRRTKPATRVIEELRLLKVLKWYGWFLHMIGLVFPGPSYMRWRYQLKSPWLLPLYYPYRWWGILKDAFRTAFTWLSLE